MNQDALPIAAIHQCKAAKQTGIIFHWKVASAATVWAATWAFIFFNEGQKWPHFSVDHFGMSNCCYIYLILFVTSDSWFPQEINAQDMHFVLSVFLLSTQDISGAIHLHAAQVHHPSFQVHLQQTASLQQPCGHDKPRLPLHTLWLPDKSGANSSWLAADQQLIMAKYATRRCALGIPRALADTAPR